MALRLPSLSAVGWFTVDKLVQQLLWLLLFTILAPILGPKPYGLFSIVMVVIGFSETILLDASVDVLLTLPEFGPEQMRTANLSSAVLGLLTAGMIALLAPLIALAFGDTDLKYLLWATAPMTILSALTATPYAVLRATWRVPRLVLRSILGLVLGGAIGIGLAFAGAGVWALAFQFIGQRICEFVILWISTPGHFRFGWSRARFDELAPVALNIFVARGMSFIGGQVPRIIVGYGLGPLNLGLFTLATRIPDIITQIAVIPRTMVGRVQLRDYPAGTPAFDDLFATMVQDVASLACPMFVGAAVIVPDLFALWLDARWAGAVLPTQLVLLSCLPMLFFFNFSQVFMASGNTAIESRVNSVQTATLILATMASVPFGLVVTCVVWLIRPFLLLPMPFYLARRRSGLAYSLSLRASAGPFAASAIMGAVVLAARPLIVGDRPVTIADFVGLVLIGAIAYPIPLWLFLPKQMGRLLRRVFVA